MTTNELIEQIGGRERLEYIVNFGAKVSNETAVMAHALLAVLDAKPAVEVVGKIGGLVKAISFEGAPSVGCGSLLYAAPKATIDESHGAAVAVPDGWKMVPVEPTREMIAKIHPIAHGTCHHCFATVNPDCEENVKLSWQDMLAAAPAPGGD